MRSRRHQCTIFTNASTSLRMQGEHSCTQSLPGLLTLTATHPTGSPWQEIISPIGSPVKLRIQRRWATVACQGGPGAISLTGF